jgi:hypothetical protein
MTKNPHLVRADLYRELFKELNTTIRASQDALDAYLARPTLANKKVLSEARDLMNQTRVDTMKKAEEIKAQQDRHL